MADLIELFFDAWGNVDETLLKATFGDCMSADFIYVDPRVSEPVTDLADLAAYVAMFGQTAPGATARVVASSGVLGHARATVAFDMAGGARQLGQYFVDRSDDGRIARMIGFAGLGEPA